MNASLLFYISLAFIVLGPLSVFGPMVNDSRIVGFLLMIIGLLLISIKLARKKLLWGYISLRFLIPVQLFILVVLITSIKNPPLGSKENLLTYLLGVAAFYYGYLFFISLKNPRSGLNLFLKAVIFATLVSVSLSLFVLVFGERFLPVYRNLVSEKGYIKFLFEYRRGRIYPLSSLEMIVPFVLAYLLGQKQLSKKRYALLLTFITTTALVISNYRNRIVSGFFAMIAMLFLPGLIKKIFPFTAIFIASMLIAVLVLPTNPVKRFLLTNEADYQTVKSRFNNLRLALEISRANFIFGVGPNNLKEFVRPTITRVRGVGGETFLYQAYQHPHNQPTLILSESGILGLSTYIILLASFFCLDRKCLAKKNSRAETRLYPLIVASWIFVFGSLMDWYSVNSIVFFFLIRGCILGYYLK